MNGIPDGAFTRVVREDPVRRGLLFAGTETGLYLSFDDGASWQPFQRNLPVVPVTDLAVKDGDLVVATQGRAFWILDDLAPLESWNADVEKKDLHLFRPSPTMRYGSVGRLGRCGRRPPARRRPEPLRGRPRSRTGSRTHLRRRPRRRTPS